MKAVIDLSRRSTYLFNYKIAQSILNNFFIIPKAKVLLSLLIVLLILLISQNLFAIEAGGPNLGQQAETALLAGDTETAVALYERWLDAAPGDYSAWYNYCCALARLERYEEAVTALDCAATAGWRDPDWPTRDPDLAPLVNLESFKRVCSRINELAEMDSQLHEKLRVPSYTHQVRIAPYLKILPNKYSLKHEPYPLVILLHGRGDDYDSMEELVERLALPNVIFALPRAPYHVHRGQDGFEYWPRDLVASGDTARLHISRTYMVEWIKSVVEDIDRAENVDRDRVVIVGHSQGAAAAYVCAMRRPEIFTAMAALSGYVPNEYMSEKWYGQLAENGIACFIGHGSRDQSVDLSRILELKSSLSESGVDVTMVKYPTGHEMTDEMIVDLADWIMEQLRNSGMTRATP